MERHWKICLDCKELIQIHEAAVEEIVVYVGIKHQETYKRLTQRIRLVSKKNITEKQGGWCCHPERRICVKFEVEFAQCTKIVIDAENKEEAEMIASIMDGDEIAKYDPHEYDIFNIKQKK